MADGVELDLKEQIVRIDRQQAEIQKLFQETSKFAAETRKLTGESLKLDRDAKFSPLVLATTAFGAGAASFASVAAFIKLLT